MTSVQQEIVNRIAQEETLLQSWARLMMFSSPCPYCDNEGWVCEEHPLVSWKDGEGCCGAAGMPCGCNNSDSPWDYRGAK